MGICVAGFSWPWSFKGARDSPIRIRARGATEISGIPSKRSDEGTQITPRYAMGLITPNDFPNLRELYTAQLRYLLSTENQIVKGLPAMIEHADDTQLKQAFQSHLQETREHVTRIETLLGEMMGNADDKKDPILTAIVGSGENITKETEAGPVRDAGLIATAQKVEHYEIASYGSARDWAKQLGLSTHVSVLQKTLDEEKHADSLLTEIAQRTNSSASRAA
jgi:ferritin-like metal-binding protein YciE